MTGEREGRVQTKGLASISTNAHQRLAADSPALPVDLKHCTTDRLTRAALGLRPTDKPSLSL